MDDAARQRELRREGTTLRSIAQDFFGPDLRGLRVLDLGDLDGRAYRGHPVREHAVGTSAEAKAGQAWASLDNETSFWLSKPSLLNLLARVGFNTVYEVSSPLVFDYWDRHMEARMRYRHRATFVGAKSPGTSMLTATAVNSVDPRLIPEDLEKQLVTWPPPTVSR